MKDMIDIKIPGLTLLTPQVGICNEKAFGEFKRILKEEYDREIKEVVGWKIVLNRTDIPDLSDLGSLSYRLIAESYGYGSSCLYDSGVIDDAIHILKVLHRYDMKFFIVPNTELPLIIQSSCHGLGENIFIFISWVVWMKEPAKCKNCGHDIIIYHHPLTKFTPIFHFNNGLAGETCTHKDGQRECGCRRPDV